MHDEERPTHRLRARHSPVAGDTPQADELAEWLRARVAGRTLRQLEELFPFGRTQWSEFLKGRKLIPLWLLDSVVAKLVPPQEQQLHRGLGHELLRAAEEADAARMAAKSPDISGSAPHDYEMRLDDARQGQIKAQETVQSLTHLIYVFISAMADLNQRCKDLEAERDQARLRLQEAETTANQQRAAENRKRAAEDQRLLAQTEQRLAEAGRRHAEFEKRLTRARREQQEAEDLRIEAFQQAEQHRRAFRQLTGRDTPAGPDGEDPGSVPAPQPWEYDHFLETADAQLDAYTAHLDAVREQIGSPVPPAPQGVRTIPGQVVRAPSTDSADTTPTSGDPVHGPSADTPDNSSDSAAEGPAAMPDNTNRQGSATLPANGAGGRKGKGMRVALVGTACLALLAGGGWLTWDHYHPQYTLADSKVLQDARANGELRIGIKENQPRLSEKINGKWSGLDIEVARNIAKKLKFKEEDIKFVPLGTAIREEELRNRKIDLFVGSYSITPDRKAEGVAFAGPYLSTDQGILVSTVDGNPEKTFVYEDGKEKVYPEPIYSVDDFKNGTKVCTAKGSISKGILARTAKNVVVEDKYADYQLCVDKIIKKSWSSDDPIAMVTDIPILIGFVAKHEGLAVIRDRVKGTTTDWGVGMVDNDPALRHLVCESIAEQIEDKTWDKLKAKLVKDVPGEFYIHAPGKEERKKCTD
ncbi:transporter substrate-binding domain-containing protein (plasmid) [Streptomyces atratus]|uniref:transporter substrate-binding domain-containing protein n=2 Tax=Streptomyces atratus TaxID=1893 RepID=UPI002F914B44